VHGGTLPTFSMWRMGAQDDDIPKDFLWADRIVRLFRNHPRLGMLGGFRGRMDMGARFDKSTG
jgi:hypothetical protein